MGFTEEVWKNPIFREKMKLRKHVSWNKGKVYLQIMGDKNPAKRPEVRRRISESNKGRITSELARQKSRERGLGNRYASGHKVSDVSKKIMSQKKIGLIIGE